MFGRPLTFGAPAGDTAGVLTTNDWTVGGDGNTYKGIWSPRWEVVTDREMPITSFRSTERWFAVAVVGGVAVAIVPGCRVHGWVRADVAPASTTLLNAGRLAS